MKQVITSKSNEKVKFIKSLNEKKGRQKNNCFYLEGIKVVNEVLDGIEAINIKFIAYSKEILQNTNGGNIILDKINRREDVLQLEFPKNIFEDLTDTKTPQGILAVLNKPQKNEISQEGNILVLDRIQDAGNLGTIIRTADAFGINQIICIDGTVDVYSPKVVRSTMGSILRTKTIYIEDLKKLNELKNFGYEIIGTTLDKKSVFLDEIDFSKKYIFIMGNEANGISDEIKQICDIFAKIPMTENAESLNVAVATSIILYKQFKK